MENFNLRSALEKTGATLDENQIKFVSAFENALNERAKAQDEAYSASMQEALRSVIGAQEKDENGNIVNIATQIRNLAEALERTEKSQIRKMDDKEKFQLRKLIEDNATNIRSAIKNGTELELEFRAAAKFTAATAVANDTGVLLPLNENYEFEEGVVRLRYPANFVLESISNRMVSKVPQQIIKNEQATQEGAVAVVAEGGTKPLISDTFLRTLTVRKKYAGHIEWTEEFEMDNERLFNDILDMFEKQVLRAWNAGLLADIVANGTAYTTSVLDDTLVVPDNALACIAAQSVINGMNFNADTVYMHPSDLVSTAFTQDVDGNFRIKPYLMDGKINGMNVYANNGVTLGTAVVMDSSIYKEQHGGFILRFGTYDDQFIKNEKSAIGEVFSILTVAKNQKPGVMAITLATVKAALLKP